MNLLTDKDEFLNTVAADVMVALTGADPQGNWPTYARRACDAAECLYSELLMRQANRQVQRAKEKVS